MRVLAIHNHYRHSGGEDSVFASEVDLLRAAGHEVVVHTVHNTAVDQLSRLRLFAQTIWASDSYLAIRRLAQHVRPQVAHFHNTLPLISPSAYYACAAENVAIVQTLHNYRLLCVNGLLMRNDRPCVECVTRRFAAPGIRHACYRNSRAASAAVATMVAVHRAAGTWSRLVDRYVVLTEFARDTFARGGLPSERLEVKPNFLAPDPGPGTHGGGFALFVGRLSTEKGLDTALRAWHLLGQGPELWIAGDGPLRALMTDLPPNVKWLGKQDHQSVLRLMGEAAVLVFPSHCYEGLPLTLVEAFARGLPVIASGHGAMHDVVSPGVTGLHVRPGDPAALAGAVTHLVAHPDVARSMSRQARAEFEARYTAEANVQQLERIYGAAIVRRGQITGAPAVSERPDLSLLSS